MSERPKPFQKDKKTNWEVQRDIFYPHRVVHIILRKGDYSDSCRVARSNNAEKMLKRIRKAKYKLLIKYRETRQYWKKERSYLEAIRMCL